MSAPRLKTSVHAPRHVRRRAMRVVRSLVGGVKSFLPSKRGVAGQYRVRRFSEHDVATHLDVRVAEVRAWQAGRLPPARAAREILALAFALSS